MKKLSKETFDLYINFRDKMVYCPKCKENIMLDFVSERNITPIVLICEECKTPVIDTEG